MKKVIEEGVKSDFLKNLQSAVNSGDAAKGAESINKINEIHKLASSMNSKTASATFEKRIEEAGEVESINQEDVKVINLRAKEIVLKIEDEDSKLRLIANIKNGETELKELNKEFIEVSKQYLVIIEKQENLIEEMKNKFEKTYKDVEKGTK